MDGNGPSGGPTEARRIWGHPRPEPGCTAFPGHRGGKLIVWSWLAWPFGSTSNPCAPRTRRSTAGHRCIEVGLTSVIGRLRWDLRIYGGEGARHGTEWRLHHVIALRACTLDVWSHDAIVTRRPPADHRPWCKNSVADGMIVSAAPYYAMNRFVTARPEGEVRCSQLRARWHSAAGPFLFPPLERALPSPR